MSFKHLFEKRPHWIPKTWGRELVYYNAEYCMKSLEFWLTCKEKSTSMHFHLKKHETFYVVSGVFILRIIEDMKLVDGKYVTVDYTLYPGDTHILPPGQPHMIICIGGEGIILESSTYDDPNDSIRLYRLEE